LKLRKKDDGQQEMQYAVGKWAISWNPLNFSHWPVTFLSCAGWWLLHSCACYLTSILMKKSVWQDPVPGWTSQWLKKSDAYQKCGRKHLLGLLLWTSAIQSPRITDLQKALQNAGFFHASSHCLDLKKKSFVLQI